MSSCARGVSSKALGKMRDLGSFTGQIDYPSDINWHDYNYPPCLMVIHYDLQEVTPCVRSKVKRLNMTFMITSFAMCLNLCNAIIFAIGTRAPGAWIFLSLVHTVVLSLASLFIFYHGYRGFCLGDKSMRRTALLLQVGMSIIYFLLFLLGSGPINGLLKLNKVKHYTETMHGYWIAMIVIESVLWIFNCFLAITTICTLHNFNDEDRRKPSGATGM